MLDHTTLSDGMNTDDLNEVYFAFLVFHGLESKDNISIIGNLPCAEELLYHYSQDLADDTDDQVTLWLKKFMQIWAKACNAEYSLGHAIENYHGWKQPK